MKTTVIIVRYNNKDIEDVCIQSVINNTSNYHLVVFDNFPENQNLGRLWNKLISKAESENICLLNSDTQVSPQWLDKLNEVFTREPNTGVVGPTTNNSHNHQSSALPTPEYNVIDFSTFKIAGTNLPEVLGGFCIIFPRKVWEEVGGIPEDYSFYGQEVIFIDKMIKAGYKQYWRKDVFVHHEGASTAKKMASLGLFDINKERQIAMDRHTKERIF
jgi:GT2 family glycosyltransferase